MPTKHNLKLRNKSHDKMKVILEEIQKKEDDLQKTLADATVKYQIKFDNNNYLY